MFIVSLFCNVDDFFSVYEKYKASQSHVQLPADRPLETRGHPHTISYNIARLSCMLPSQEGVNNTTLLSALIIKLFLMVCCFFLPL